MSRQMEYPVRIVQRAEEANRLLNGEVCAEVFDACRELFRREWEDSDPEDAARRELCWAKVQGLNEVQRQLRRMVRQGEVAATMAQRERNRVSS